MNHCLTIVPDHILAKGKKNREQAIALGINKLNVNRNIWIFVSCHLSPAHIDLMFIAKFCQRDTIALVKFKLTIIFLVFRLYDKISMIDLVVEMKKNQ